MFSSPVNRSVTVEIFITSHLSNLPKLRGEEKTLAWSRHIKNFPTLKAHYQNDDNSPQFNIISRWDKLSTCSIIPKLKEKFTEEGQSPNVWTWPLETLAHFPLSFNFNSHTSIVACILNNHDSDKKIFH